MLAQPVGRRRQAARGEQRDFGVVQVGQAGAAFDRGETGRHHVLGKHGDAQPRLDRGVLARERGAAVGDTPRSPEAAERIGGALATSEFYSCQW